MWLLYADETNLDPTKSEFFLYGGLAIPPKGALALDEELRSIRKRSGVPEDFVFKFNPGPPNMPHADVIAIKSQFLQAASTHGARPVLYAVLHKIIKDSDIEKARRMAISTVIYHFNCVCHREKGVGLVLLDRFSDKPIDSQIQSMIQVGLKGMPYSAVLPLDRIVGIHLSQVNHSNFCSLTDITLGSFRFAVNALMDENNTKLDSAREILKLISPLLPKEDFDGTNYLVPEVYLQFSPKGVKVDQYRARYDRLKSILGENGVPASQQIVAQVGRC